MSRIKDYLIDEFINKYESGNSGVYDIAKEMGITYEEAINIMNTKYIFYHSYPEPIWVLKGGIYEEKENY